MEERDKKIESIKSNMKKLGGLWYPGIELSDLPIMTADAWDSKINGMNETELTKLHEKTERYVEQYKDTERK